MYRNHRLAIAIGAAAAAFAAQDVGAGVLEQLTASNESVQVEASAEETPSEEVPEEAEEKKLNGGWSLNLANSYIARPGFIPVDGPVVQSSANAKYGNLSGFVWQNSDFKRQKVTEIDVGANYHHGVFRIGPQLWIFPQAEGGNKVDGVLEAGAHHSGAVEADATATYLISQGDTEAGLMLRGTVAKPIKLEEGILTSSVTVAGLENFYGVTGMAYVTGGISYEQEIGPVTASIKAAYQHSLNDALKDKLQVGIGVRGNF